jgi:squalene synthase HpnC
MARSITLDLKHLGPASPRAQWSLAKSRSYCQDLTRTHYENFSVLSCFVPGNLLADFRAIYAFCRWADDLGDEISSDTESLSLLNWWQDELLDCFQPHGKPWHPVHVALAETIRRHNLPKEPFLDLIAAFKQDRAVKEYESVEQLEDYCTRSANPVGRLVLHLAGAFTPQRALLSDFTCTGLQLANFWQDVARDRAIGRIYLPGDARTRHGVSINDLDSPHASPDLKKLILELVSSTRSYFVRGEPLEHELPFPINRQIGLFRRGGLCILDAIEQQQGDVLTQRPTVSKRAKLM